MDTVAIAGAGPAGLALALTLARHGVPATVFAEHPAPTPVDESRAITWMPRGLEFLDWAGITDGFERMGCAGSHTSSGRRAVCCWRSGTTGCAMRTRTR